MPDDLDPFVKSLAKPAPAGGVDPFVSSLGTPAAATAVADRDYQAEFDALPPEQQDEQRRAVIEAMGAWARPQHETTLSDIKDTTTIPDIADVVNPVPSNPFMRELTAPPRAAAQAWIDRARTERNARAYAAAHPNGPPAPDPNLPSVSAPPLEPAPVSSAVAAGAKTLLSPFAWLSEPSAMYHEGEAERDAARRARQLETGAYQPRTFPEKVQDFVGTSYGAANMEPAFDVYGEKVIPGAQSLGRALGGQTGENLAGAAAEVAPLVLAHALGAGTKLADAARARSRFAIPIPEAGGPVGVEHGIGPRPAPEPAVVAPPDPRALPRHDLVGSRVPPPAVAPLAPGEVADPFVRSLQEPRPDQSGTVRAPVRGPVRAPQPAEAVADISAPNAGRYAKTGGPNSAFARRRDAPPLPEPAPPVGDLSTPSAGREARSGGPTSPVKKRPPVQGAPKVAQWKPRPEPEIRLAPEPTPPPPEPVPPSDYGQRAAMEGVEAASAPSAGRGDAPMGKPPNPNMGKTRPKIGRPRPQAQEAPPEPRPSTQEPTRPETPPARETPPVEAETPFERKMREAAEAKPAAEAPATAPAPEAPAAAEHPAAAAIRKDAAERRARIDPTEPKQALYDQKTADAMDRIAAGEPVEKVVAEVKSDPTLQTLVYESIPEMGKDADLVAGQIAQEVARHAETTRTGAKDAFDVTPTETPPEAPPERQPSPAPEGPSPKKEDVVTRGAEDTTPQQAPEAGTAPVEGGAPEAPPARAKVGKPRVTVPVEEAAPRAKVGKPRKGSRADANFKLMQDNVGRVISERGSNKRDLIVAVEGNAERHVYRVREVMEDGTLGPERRHSTEPDTKRGVKFEDAPARTSKPPAEPREGPTAGAGLGALQGVLTEEPVREYVPTDPVAKAAYERANLTTRWKPPKKPISERIVDAYRALRRFGRTEAPLAEFERNQYGKNLPGGLEQEAQFAQRGAGSQLQALIDQGELLTERVSPRSIREDLTALRPDQERVLSLYLQAKNEARFRSQGKEYHLSQADAKAIIDDTAKNHPEVVRAAETIRDTFDFLAKKRVEAGILSQKSLDAMRAAGEYYGPVERVVGEQQGDGGTGGRGALNQASLPRTKGSTRGVDDPVPGLFRALEGHIRAINEGFTGKALVEAHDANPAKASPFMREIVGKNLSETLKRVGDRTDFKSFVADWEAKHGPRDAANVQEFWDAYNAKNNERVVITHIDGKTRAFEFPRPDLYEAAMGLTHKFEAPIGTRTIFKIIRAMGSTFRTGTTVLSAAFNLGQLTRDPRVAFVLTSDPKMLPYEAPLRTALGYAKALRGDKSALTALYKQLGIDTMLTVDRHDAGAVIRDFTSKDFARTAKKAINPRKWLDLVREIGGRIEAGPREGEVGGVIERRGFKPGDKNIPRKVLVEASSAGNTVTAPFKLGSQASKVVSSFYPFFSARLQANIATAQLALRRPATFAARVTAVSIIPRMILWALNKDEDWYKRMPSWKKYGLWHFSDDLQFPTINILDIPAITLEYALNRLNDEDPDAGSQIASQWLEELLPTGDVVTKPGQIVPQIAKPLVEHAAGRDFFTGNDINPPWKEGEKATRPDLVRRPETAPILSDVSKIIWENTGGSPANPQRGLHVTPEELKHAIGGYLGVIGKNFASVSPAGATAEGADVPGIGRFTPRIRVSVHVENYYRKKKEREGAVQAFRDLAAEGKSDEAGQYAPSKMKKVGGVLDKIDAAMTALRTKYDQAPTDAEKKSVAEDMDKLAKVGITVLDAVAPKESSK